MADININSELIKEAVGFFKKLDFRSVDSRLNGLVVGEVFDIAAVHEKTAIICICKSGRKNFEKEILAFKSNISKIKASLRAISDYKNCNKYVFTFYVKNAKIDETSRSLALTLPQSIHILDTASIKYFFDLAKEIDGKYSKYSLLGEWNVKPEKEESLMVPTLAVPIKSSRNILYLFSIRAKEFLKYAYVNRRREGTSTDAYQRLLKNSRIKDIADSFLDKKNGNFVNSIIIKLVDGKHSFHSLDGNFKNQNNKYKEATEKKYVKEIQFGVLELQFDYRSCFVIDGQHRLFSYELARNDGYIVISGLSKVNNTEEANFFLKINNEAKRVDKNLIWDILGDISPNSKEGIISNACKKLYSLEGAFKNKIKIPSINSKGKISFGGLCRTLEEETFPNEMWGKDSGDTIKNPFFDNASDQFSSKLATGINSFIEELRKEFPEDIASPLFVSDGFLAVIIKLSRQYFIYNKSITVKPDKKFFQTLQKATKITDVSSVKATKKRLSSDGAKKDYFYELINEVQQNHRVDFGPKVPVKRTLGQKIIDLEERFLDFVHDKVVKHCGNDDYLKKIFNNEHPNWVKKEKISKRPPHRQMNFKEHCFSRVIQSKNPSYPFWDTIFKDIFFDAEFGFHNESDLVNSLELMGQYRADSAAHGTSDNWPEFKRKQVELNYEKLIKLIDKYSN